MVECELLDRLSILTYLAQFYQTFHGATNPGCTDTRKAATRTTSSASNSSRNSPAKTPSKAPLLGRKNEPCKVCNKGKLISNTPEKSTGSYIIKRKYILITKIYLNFRCVHIGTFERSRQNSSSDLLSLCSM